MRACQNVGEIAGLNRSDVAVRQMEVVEVCYFLPVILT